jgi:predicted ATP-grasp superfamily ATP-dependent carboligase
LRDSASLPVNTQARVFTLGMGVNGLGIARSLGEAGIRVTGVAVAGWAPEFFSRYCERLVCPSPVSEPERVLELLLAEGKRLERPAVLLPASDAFALFLSRHRAELRRRFLFALPSPSVSEALVDKRLQYGMAARLGIPCPRTFHPRSVADVERIKREIDYPAFLKPCASHLWAPVFGVKGFRIDGPTDLERRLAEVAPSGLDVIVQAIVPGPSRNLYVVCTYVDDSNRPLVLYVQRRIRQYPTDFGNGALNESVHAPDVAELGAELLQRLEYRGLGCIEFKRDVRTGELKLIELNPRLNQGHIVATRCGANSPLIAYLDLTGQKPAPVTRYREGVRYLVVGKDVRAFLDLHRRGELGLLEWVRSALTARVFPYFDLRDPLPFLMATPGGLWRRFLTWPAKAWQAMWRRAARVSSAVIVTIGGGT